MDNLKICQETELMILLPAGKIPDSAIIRKRTGEARYVLRNKLTLWQSDERRKEGNQAVPIAGFFLVGERGDINQVSETTMLHWIISTENFIDIIQRSWDEENNP